MANEKSDSHTARKNLPKLAGFIIGVALLIALAYIYHLNGYGETASPTLAPTSEPVVTFLPTNTQAIIPTNTPTAEEIEKSKQEEILGIMESQESRWVEMGYLPEFTKNGEVLTQKTIEINGQEVEAVGFRIGMTEIWTDRELIDRTLDYYAGVQKQIGETIIPNKKVEDWRYKAAIVGAYIQASNMGFGEDVLGYLKSMSANINADPTANMYTIQDFREGADGLIRITDLPQPINASLPVRLFIGNTTLTREEVDKGRIYGGDPKAPYNLPYYVEGGWSGVFVGDNGGMTIAFDQALFTESGFGNDYYLDTASKILYATQVGVIQSMRGPKSSGFGFDKFRYIAKTILAIDDYPSALFIWGNKYINPSQ